jgi:hypothetical protein
MKAKHFITFEKKKILLPSPPTEGQVRNVKSTNTENMIGVIYRRIYII